MYFFYLFSLQFQSSSKKYYFPPRINKIDHVTKPKLCSPEVYDEDLELILTQSKPLLYTFFIHVLLTQWSGLF